MIAFPDHYTYGKDNKLKQNFKYSQGIQLFSHFAFSAEHVSEDHTRQHLPQNIVRDIYPDIPPFFSLTEQFEKMMESDADFSKHRKQMLSYERYYQRIGISPEEEQMLYMQRGLLSNNIMKLMKSAFGPYAESLEEALGLDPA